MIRSNCWGVFLGLVLAACATATPGANPHDMGATDHDRDARTHAAKVAEHEAQFDPGASTTRERCRNRIDRLALSDICWTSTTNPTMAHLKMAEQHRRQAADHRAASMALRAAEASACAGIAPADRDVSPFDHVDDITKVETLRNRGVDQQGPERVVGATVTFRGTPGLSADSLQHIVECHLARNAALGHVSPNMPNCPLVPKGVRAEVTATESGISVAVRAEDPQTAAEIVSRAERLRAAAGAK